MIEAIDGLELSYKAIYEKKRFDTAGQYVEDDDFVKGERGDFPVIVQENGIRYAVDLNDGAMTGIFLDQRHVRKAIRDKYANGRRVLNTFSYTGHFPLRRRLEELRKRPASMSPTAVSQKRLNSSAPTELIMRRMTLKSWMFSNTSAMRRKRAGV